jgi:hypothetical protein
MFPSKTNPFSHAFQESGWSRFLTETSPALITFRGAGAALVQDVKTKTISPRIANIARMENLSSDGKI